MTFSMPRYVPKTYNNRRGLRIVISTIITLALSLVILFLILFFVFAGYVGEDGQLNLPPWLAEEITSLTVMRERLYKLIETEKNK